jgi:putative peptide zinc metalloprotease protein
MKRRLLTILLAALLGLGVAGTPASAASPENTAIALNTKDGATVVKTAFAIRHVMSGIVDNTNAAVAYAKCKSCTTVAIAIEIVLVESNPTVFKPTNAAVAYNELCSLCITVANALQFVVTTGGPVRFDERGAEILDQVRDELDNLKDALKEGSLTLDQLQARVESIRLRIIDVLQHHLVPVRTDNNNNNQQEGQHVNETPATPATVTGTTTTDTSTTQPQTDTQTTTTNGVTTTTP